MARGPKPTVLYWKSRKAYARWIGETRHFLARGPNDALNGPTYFEALDRFRKLVVQDDGNGMGGSSGRKWFRWRLMKMSPMTRREAT